MAKAQCDETCNPVQLNLVLEDNLVPFGTLNSKRDLQFQNYIPTDKFYIYILTTTYITEKKLSHHKSGKTVQSHQVNLCRP